MLAQKMSNSPNTGSMLAGRYYLPFVALSHLPLFSSPLHRSVFHSSTLLHLPKLFFSSSNPHFPSFIQFLVQSPPAPLKTEFLFFKTSFSPLFLACKYNSSKYIYFDLTLMQRLYLGSFFPHSFLLVSITLVNIFTSI
jgi:hypothetical protein